MKSITALLTEYLARHPGEVPNPVVLAKRLGIPKSQRQVFLDTLASLLRRRGVVSKKSDRRKEPDSHEDARSSQGLVAGIIRKIEHGAFFTAHPPDGVANSYLSDRSPKDIFISAKDLRSAQDGDEVLVRILNTGRGGRRNGRVEEVIARQSQVFVGTYFEHDGLGLVRVDGKTFELPVLVGDPGAKGAQPDDKVVIEMTRFPTVDRSGEAVITELLGARGEPGVDIKAIMREFSLLQQFSEEALKEAREQAAQFDETNLNDRLDLTRELIVTIDPIDARDFDDAISLTRSDDGHWHLGVHIADVSHFVPEGGELDREALQRGTSVYLPGRVIPMLPEIISNSLASLQQGHVRYTKSALMEFDATGLLLHTEFHNSAINVTRRFAYEEVMPALRDPLAARETYGDAVLALLARMHELAMTLRKRRFEQGALELYLPEVKVKLDPDGKVVGAAEAVHDESHQIIEEFMLAANMAVATRLADLGIHFLRRIHSPPDEIKLKSFADFVTSLGFPMRRGIDRFQLQDLLNRVKGQPFEQAVNFALLRSMRQAEYSGQVDDHYALAVANYCHFTSPIRRYPDLTVHRLIDAVIQSGATQLVMAEEPKNTKFSKKSGPKGPKKQLKQKIGSSSAEVQKLGRHCSLTERRAADAERQLVKVKLLTLLQTKRDETFEAVITGIEKYGVFARCSLYPVDGFIPIEQLQHRELLDYDRATRTLSSRRSGVVFRFGGRLSVTIGRINPDARLLEWKLAAPPANDLPAEPAIKNPRRRIREAGDSETKTRKPTAKRPKRQR